MAVPILLYHQIAVPPSRRAPFRSMAVHPEAFHNQMAWLKRLGVQGLSLRESLPYIQGAKTGKVAAITFDDSYANVYENALPVLQEFGFTATNFVVANQVGGSNVWDIPNGVARAPCMSLEQLRKWVALGHEVGSHTLDHVHLPQLPMQEARRQIAHSRELLEDMLDEIVSSFCFPYGDEMPLDRVLAYEAGYSAATTTRRGRARQDHDPFGLPRATVRRNDSWLHFIRKCVSG
ncbi:polysaccharide deacetylase family protein [Agrobacterium rhizogenes]|uniref:polysaccharide deacetylase family protein n=1 Tax=Rhizobium TaxID=379 RepID=UPI00026EE90D|nr:MULTISPECIES: polysaccharide deacetylase family protein [Rhizobium]EJK79727.1 putative xylanase/chitin deacetylase [Rhizobium sp. AP16]NTF88346.1 polysaccharide deacetylase family protein [Rhizobium rhizogenes]